MISIYNARAKKRSIHSHRERGVYEGIVERMKKGINVKNKNGNKKATRGREMGKEGKTAGSDENELKKKHKTWNEKRLKARMK